MTLARVLAVTAAVVILASPASARQVTQQEIEQELTCQCGCGLTVHACNHLQCPSAGPLRHEIAELIAAGKTREDILRHFRARYGEKILSAPTMEGFNLTAWITPFAAVLLGGLGLALVVRRWVKAAAVNPPPPSPGAASERLRAKLERELAELDR